MQAAGGVDLMSVARIAVPLAVFGLLLGKAVLDWAGRSPDGKRADGATDDPWGWGSHDGSCGHDSDGGGDGGGHC